MVMAFPKALVVEPRIRRRLGASPVQNATAIPVAGFRGGRRCAMSCQYTGYRVSGFSQSVAEMDRG